MKRTRKIDPARVMDAVRLHYGVTARQIADRSGPANVQEARTVSLACVDRLCGLTQAQTAALHGGRRPSAVVLARRTVAGLLLEDAPRLRIEAVLRELGVLRKTTPVKLT